MPRARRGGTETFWRVWGEGPRRTLMIHCTLAHSGAWNGLAALLSLPAIAFDMPGHGQSGPRDVSVDYQLQCLRVATDFCADGPMDIIGHSFGATVALRLAVERPQAVRRLVLIEPVFFAAACGTAEFETYTADFQPFVTAMQAGDTELAAQRFTEMWGTGVAWDDMREAQRLSLAEQIDIIPAQQGAIFDDNAGLLGTGRLEAVVAPVLLIEGSASPPIIGAVADAISARLPDAQRAVVQGAGHMLPITHPRQVVDHIVPFISP